MTFGECELAIGDAPDKAKAVRDATATAGGQARAPLPSQTTTPTAAAPEAAAEKALDDDAVSGANGKIRRGKKESEPQPESA